MLAGDRRLLADSKDKKVDPKKVDKTVDDVMKAVEGPVIDIVNSVTKIFPNATKRLTEPSVGHHNSSGHHPAGSGHHKPTTKPVNVTDSTKKVFDAVKKPVHDITNGVVKTVSDNKKSNAAKDKKTAAAPAKKSSATTTTAKKSSASTVTKAPAKKN